MTYAPYVFLIVVCQLTHIETHRATGSPEDVVFRDIGAKIEKLGKSVSSENEIMISVIIKFPNISRIGDVEAAFSNPVVHRLHQKCSTSKFYQTVWETNNKYYRIRSEAFLKSKKALLKPFITPLNRTSEGSTRRSKRGLLSFLGNMGLTLFMGGISEAQIYRLNKHVDRNSDAIDLLRHGILQEQSEIKSLSEHVVGFMRDTTMALTLVVDREETCSVFYNQWSAKLRQGFMDDTKEIDDTLWTAINGENSLLLSPRMLNLDLLKKIILKSRDLQGTIFEKSPTFLYSLAKMSLIEVEENLLYAHFVLMIPTVREVDTVNLYRVSQVGTHLVGETCVYHKFPDFLYKRKDQAEFLPISLDRCNKHNDLYVCPYEDFSNETSCIQENSNSCVAERHSCLHSYQFVMSQVGILLRNNMEGKTFSADLDGMTSNVKLSKYGTTYLYWKGLSSVQIGNKKILSPNMEHVELKISNLSPDTESVMSYLDSHNVTNVFKNVCDKYNKSLEDLINPVFERLFVEKKQHSIDWVTLTILLVLVVAILVWLGYLQFWIKKLQTPQQVGARQSGSQVELVKLGSPRCASF